MGVAREGPPVLLKCVQGLCTSADAEHALHLAELADKCTIAEGGEFECHYTKDAATVGHRFGAGCARRVTPQQMRALHAIRHDKSVRAQAMAFLGADEVGDEFWQRMRALPAYVWCELASWKAYVKVRASKRHGAS